MFDRVFNMDNGFWRAMSKVADIIILNLLFIVCSIPVFTIGASFTALYTVMLKLVKNEESYIFKGFLTAFRDNFKQATFIWLIMLAAGCFIGADLYLSSIIEGTFMSVLHYVFMAFALVYAMILCYVFPIQCKFENTLRNTLKNALFMSIAHFPWTILILLVSAIPIVAIMIMPGLLLFILPAMLFFGFSLIAFINSFMFNRVFKRYIPEEGAADATEGTTEKDAGEDAGE